MKNLSFKARDPRKILLAVPIKDNMRWQTLWTLTQIPILQGYEITMIPFGGCDICHARNLAFHYWRTRSDAARLLFLDTDLTLDPALLEGLLGYDVPVIAGLYPLSDTYLRWSYQGWRRPDPVHNGLWTVQEVCTGLLCLRFDVLEKLIREEDRFQIEDAEYRGEIGYEVTKMCVVDWRRYPEDFYLSKIMREAGYAIRVNPMVRAGHVKTVDILKRWTEDEINESLKLPQLHAMPPTLRRSSDLSVSPCPEPISPETFPAAVQERAPEQQHQKHPEALDSFDAAQARWAAQSPGLGATD